MHAEQHRVPRWLCGLQQEQPLEPKQPLQGWVWEHAVGFVPGRCLSTRWPTRAEISCCARLAVV